MIILKAMRCAWVKNYNYIDIGDHDLFLYYNESAVMKIIHNHELQQQVLHRSGVSIFDDDEMIM